MRRSLPGSPRPFADHACQVFVVAAFGVGWGAARASASGAAAAMAVARHDETRTRSPAQAATAVATPAPMPGAPWKGGADVEGKPSAGTGRVHTLHFRGLLKESAPRSLSVSQLAAAVRAGNPVGTTLVSAFKDEGPARYFGVDLRRLREAYALPGARRARVVAVNKYEQTLAFDEAGIPAAVLAFERDGAPIPTHARGSFRILMDLSAIPAEKREAVFPYFVWSVTSIEFLP